MHEELRDVLTRLEAVRETSGGWQARCPAHDDHDPSLSVSAGDSQPVVLHCWAGCTPAEIVAALGLEFSDICEGEASSGSTSEVLSEVQKRRQRLRRRKANTDARLRRVEQAKAKMTEWERRLFRLCSRTQHNGEAATEMKKAKRTDLVERALDR